MFSRDSTEYEDIPGFEAIVNEPIHTNRSVERSANPKLCPDSSLLLQV